jgi:MiaB-like-C: MiaB-like tRNA modifying enzyme
MSKRRAAFLTLGCKVNQYETDAMEEILEKAGYEIVSFKETADVYIINTCSVTNMADRKSRQMIHRAKEKQSGCNYRGSGVLCAGSRGRTSKEK